MSAQHEMIIIKRHGDHDEGHHGGAWKVAFADFMTAMMALFLVLWLMSSSEKNREAIARYFNPLKLVDTTTRPKGPHDVKKDETNAETGKVEVEEPNIDPPKKEADKKPEADKKTADKPSEKPKEAKCREPIDQKPTPRSETRLFQDPYGALAEIVNGPDEQSPRRDGKRSGEGAKGGERFRDPFAPPPPPVALGEPEPDADGPAASPAQTAVADDAAPAPDSQPAAVKALKAKLEQAIGSAAGSTPGLEVRKTAEGLLVSLTDKTDYAMFARGSAEPGRRLVVLMANVARVLQKQPGSIIVRGHTDAQKYRAGTYDNWRLSSDRAQMAHYMLVRGGLDEKRILRVEGYADHDPKTPADPLGAQNRRIEILVRSAQR